MRAAALWSSILVLGVGCAQGAEVSAHPDALPFYASAGGGGGAGNGGLFDADQPLNAGDGDAASEADTGSVAYQMDAGSTTGVIPGVDAATSGDVDAGVDAGEPVVNPPFDPECPRTYAVPGSVKATTHKVKDLTGSATSSAQFGVGGTDLGIAVRQPNGKIAYIFGDTFEQDGVGGAGWRAPVLLRSEPGLPAGGIVFNSAAGGQYAKQILSYAHTNGRTYLPSDAITIGNRMYLHYMVNEGLGNVLWTQIAYSDDNGENWTSDAGARWEANENDFLQQMWTWERGCDGYVYVLSTKFISRDRAIILHRVPEDQLLVKSAYQPWGYANGQWAWGNPATIVLDGKFGEMSLRRVENKWVLAWFNAGDYEITIKVFASPTSNLFTATTYHPIHGGEWGAENNTTVAQLYGGYIHPDSTLHDLNLIVSQWNTNTNWPYRAMQFVTGVD